MLQWHVSLSVPKHYPYSGNFMMGMHHVLPQTIIPIQLTLLACIIAHMSYHRVFQKLLFSQKLWRFWASFNTLIPLNELKLILRDFYCSLAVKMPNFWGPKIDKSKKKVINSSTKCLISVKIAILTPNIIPPPLVNSWLIFDLQTGFEIRNKSKGSPGPLPLKLSGGPH